MLFPDTRLKTGENKNKPGKSGSQSQVKIFLRNSH
jgi:hypothetical protein